MTTHSRNRLANWIVLGLVTCTFCLCFSSTFAQDRRSEVKQTGGKKSSGKVSSFSKVDSSLLALVKSILEEPRNSTVRIQCDGKNVALGTVVDQNGWIVTKASVLEGTPKVVLNDGREFEAKVIGQHEEHDLTLLKIKAKKLTPVSWRSSKEVPVGYWAISVGTGTAPMALGVVSVATRTIRYPKDYRPQLVKNSGYMGVALAPNEKLAVIDQVMPNSGAAKAGIKVKDIILSVSGKAIADAQGLIAVLDKYNPGDKVVVKIKRGEDEEMELKVTLGKRDLSRGDIQNNMGSKLSKRIDGFPVILQHDSIVLPDECGGPLVDLDGKVIGINISRAGRTESYAIPAEVVQSILQEMKSGKFALAQNTSESSKEPKKNETTSEVPDRPRPNSEPQTNPTPQPLQPETPGRRGQQKD